MIPSKIKNRKILFAALDWGMGHVTRSIGLLKELETENSITIACTPEQQKLFASYLSKVQFVQLDGYNLQFSGRGTWNLDLLKQSFSFLKAIRRENEFVAAHIKKHETNLIISDHRYGFFHPEIESIFVTHQLHLPLSNWYAPIQKWHEKKLRCFNKLWILDSTNHTLAGKLSQPIRHPQINYIGFRSRLTMQQENPVYDYLIVISGPEAYATLLLGEVLRKVDFGHKKIAVLHPGFFQPPSGLNMEISFFKTGDLQADDRLFAQSETIISRAGYSTLMDLKTIDKKGILIPTPGQAEQIYLAKHLKDDSQFQFI